MTWYQDNMTEVSVDYYIKNFLINIDQIKFFRALNKLGSVKFYYNGNIIIPYDIVEKIVKPKEGRDGIYFEISNNNFYTSLDTCGWKYYRGQPIKLFRKNQYCIYHTGLDAHIIILKDSFDMIDNIWWFNSRLLNKLIWRKKSINYPKLEEIPYPFIKAPPGLEHPLNGVRMSI